MTSRVKLKSPGRPHAGTSEPIAWHSLPELVWQAILFDFKIGAAIYLTPADGMLAMAALHAHIPYTGRVFTRRHADELLHRLQSLVIARATRERDTRYDPQPRGISHYFEAEGEGTKTPKANATAETDAETKLKAKKKGEPCNKVPTHGKKGIQDGTIIQI